MANAKDHAHELIDRMAPEQVEVVVGILQIILDPVARRLDSAPFEDEAISEDETRAVAAAKTWLKNNKAISNEDILADFGFNNEDFEQLGRTPLTHTNQGNNRGQEDLVDRSGPSQSPRYRSGHWAAHSAHTGSFYRNR